MVFLSPSRQMSDSVSNQAKAMSFHILSNSWFNNNPINQRYIVWDTDSTFK
jgi:hypothetical protein